MDLLDPGPLSLRYLIEGTVRLSAIWDFCLDGVLNGNGEKAGLMDTGLEMRIYTTTTYKR